MKKTDTQILINQLTALGCLIKIQPRQVFEMYYVSIEHESLNGYERHAKTLNEALSQCLDFAKLNLIA